MREFDHCLGLRCRRDEFAVAERPVIAASCSGSACANVGAPDDDGDVVGNDEPRKVRERDLSDLGNACRRRVPVDDTSSDQPVTCINSFLNHLSAQHRPQAITDVSPFASGLSTKRLGTVILKSTSLGIPLRFISCPARRKQATTEDRGWKQEATAVHEW